MDVNKKIEIALKECERHTRVYGRKIPDRILRFWKTAEAFRYDKWCTVPGPEIPNFGHKSMRLAVTVPSWEIQSTAGGVDSAIVGPGGGWEQSKNFLPLFSAEQSRLVVVNLLKRQCPVGWYDEECWQKDGDGYVTGVYMLSPSLDKFLPSLVRSETGLEAGVERDGVEDVWEEAEQYEQLDEAGDVEKSKDG